jgi:CheY-like chemotaxis protein
LTSTDTQMRLLIIEDDRESADYLVKAFREVGYVADHAGDGEEGLALAEGGDYDVLVIDRMLPKRDGLSVIGALRDKGNRTPALILSALGPAATTICRNPMPSRSFWRASKCCRGGTAVPPRKPATASAISNSIVCRIGSPAARKS